MIDSCDQDLILIQMSCSSNGDRKYLLLQNQKMHLCSWGIN